MNYRQALNTIKILETKLATIQVGATANKQDSFLLNRVNHIGNQSADFIVDGAIKKIFTLEEKNNIESGLESVNSMKDSVDKITNEDIVLGSGLHNGIGEFGRGIVFTSTDGSLQKLTVELINNQQTLIISKV